MKLEVYREDFFTEVKIYFVLYSKLAAFPQTCKGSILERHCVKASEFFLGYLCNYFSCLITVRITFTTILLLLLSLMTFVKTTMQTYTECNIHKTSFDVLLVLTLQLIYIYTLPQFKRLVLVLRHNSN